MKNEEFKEILSEVGMTKKQFAEKIGLAYQTVAGWTNQGYPAWVDSYTKMMLELHRCMVLSKLQSKSGIDKVDGNMSEEDYFKEELKKMKLSQEKLLDKLFDLEKNLNSISLESHSSNKSK